MGVGQRRPGDPSGRTGRAAGRSRSCRARVCLRAGRRPGGCSAAATAGPPAGHAGVTTKSASRPAEASSRRARTRTPPSSLRSRRPRPRGGRRPARRRGRRGRAARRRRPGPGAGRRACAAGSSMPSPCQRGDRHRARVLGRRAASRPRCGAVGLVEHEQLGHLVGADLGQHRAHGVDLGLRDRRRCASTTWTSRSASATTSSVLLNASTSPWGSWRTKPTVSVSSTGSPPGRASRRVVGSRVANRRSSTSTPASVRRLSSVRLPGVRVADDASRWPGRCAGAACAGAGGCGADPAARARAW